MNGLPVPEKFEVPELDFGLSLYLDAFLELDSERTHFHGPTRIPWSSIARYAEFNEFTKEQAENLFFFVRKLDEQVLKEIEEKQEAERKRIAAIAKVKKLAGK